MHGGSDRPLAYSAFGAGCAEVEIDVLTGDRIIHRCDILFDCGHSFNPAVDIGQVLLAGALQGQILIDAVCMQLMPDGPHCSPRQHRACRTAHAGETGPGATCHCMGRSVSPSGRSFAQKGCCVG